MDLPQLNGSERSRGHKITIRTARWNTLYQLQKHNLEQDINKAIHLTKLQLVILLSFLKHYEDFFRGNLVESTKPPVDIPLKDKAKSYHA